MIKIKAINARVYVQDRLYLDISNCDIGLIPERIYRLGGRWHYLTELRRNLERILE